MSNNFQTVLRCFWSCEHFFNFLFLLLLAAEQVSPSFCRLLINAIDEAHWEPCALRLFHFNDTPGSWSWGRWAIYDRLFVALVVSPPLSWRGVWTDTVCTILAEKHLSRFRMFQQRAATPTRGRGPMRVTPTFATSFVDNFKVVRNFWTRTLPSWSTLNST